MAHGLDRTEKKAVLREIEQEVAASARKDQFVFFREYNKDQERAYACELERLGYFRAELLPGMQLRIEWNDLDEYLRALRSSYRRHFRRDLRAGDQLSWEWCESFDDLADVAAELFDNVHFKAEFRFERLTPAFFYKISSFGPARLLVAREPDSSKIVGFNLLLFTENEVQSVYIGMDYDHNEPYRLYFNLFERSLIAALEHGASRCTLGSDSYTFKSRLGAEPYRLVGYFWHRKRWVRFVLRTLWQWMFDDMQVMNRRVFSDDAGAREGAQKD